MTAFMCPSKSNFPPDGASNSKGAPIHAWFRPAPLCYKTRMNISLKSVRPASSSEWDTIWEKCSYATYFHSREWAEIWKAYSKESISPDPKFLEFSDGKKALLPLSKRRKYKGLMNSYLSSPAGTFGGWISVDSLTAEHAKLLTEFMIHLGNLTWRLNPYHALAFKSGVQITKDDETHTLNLSPGFESILKAMTKGHASAARKAAKSGVQIEIGSTPEDWKAYYGAYQNSLQRWGDRASSQYGWEFFNQMQLRDSPNIKLWLAKYEGKVVAGALCLYALKHVVYWHGAALDEFFNLRPVNLLICEAIKEACDQGFLWFDFNPSGPHEGVRNFKKSFGTQTRPCGIVRSNSMLHKLINFTA